MWFGIEVAYRRAILRVHWLRSAEGGRKANTGAVMMSRRSHTALCFTSLLVVGVGFTLVGLLVIPILPAFQLDAVLSEAELRDDKVREATMALLRRAVGNGWILWTVAGLLVVMLSATGLYCERQRVRGGAQNSNVLGR
jgi:hypothetical protein